MKKCCLNQINTIQFICKVFDWEIISSSIQETQTYQYSALLLWNSRYFKKVAIKLGPVNKIDVYLNRMMTNSNESMTTFDWIEVENQFDKVDLVSLYPGRTIINKFEYFLADNTC